MHVSDLMNFLLYFCVTVPMLGVGIYFFMLTTPYREFALLEDGGDGLDARKAACAQAAAYDTGGKVLGLGMVLASAIFHSLGIGDVLIWGILGMVFQVLVYYLYEIITPFKVRTEIPKGNVAVGILSAFISLTAGLIMAALIS
ncbi:MAG: DUF350 domain-containing protein [Bacillota bacterium]|nr:hypothetical protein [Bacillota bacterium]HWR56482.1 DUF350 domain-containing protein [Negativicutes bacterium]